MDGAGEAQRFAAGRWISAGVSRAAALASRFRTRRHSFLPILLVLFIALTSRVSAASAADLYTWPGWEPDKGATAWYWLRFVDTRARVHVMPAGSTDAPGTFFDTPTADFRRSQSSSTFESLLRAHPTSDPAILKLAQLTRDIEINAWRPRVHRESVELESAFRRLQQRWPDADPPARCVIEFFDRVHTWLSIGGPLEERASPACRGAGSRNGGS